MTAPTREHENPRQRTKQFALRIIRAVQAIPKTLEGRHIGGQLLKSGTSVGANYRVACRARSTREFLAKLGIVEEEADESQFWMELLVEAEIMSEAKLSSLYDEAGEILSIVVASMKTARRGKK